MWKSISMKNKKRPIAALVATLLAAAVLAGCAHPPEEDTGDQQDTGFNPSGDPFEPTPPSPPEAILSVDPAQGWVGDNFTFDASASTMSPGEITSWHFEFGDGNSLEIQAPDQPIVEHDYSAGGLYTVNLTVQARAEAQAGDDGNTTQGAAAELTSTTSIGLAVHERFDIPETELDSGLLGSTETENHSLSVHNGAANFTATVQIENTHLLLDAEGTLRVLDPDGEVLAEKEFNVSAGDEDTFTLEGDFNATGDHTLEVELDGGAITYRGDVAVHYGVQTEAAARPDDDPDDNDY